MQAKVHATKWILCLLIGGAACSGSKATISSSATQTCVGTPVACGLLSPLQCTLTAGCAPGACSGPAASCTEFTTSTECVLQQGCTPNGGACAGVALSCLALSADSECRAQRGCSWQSGCAGRAAACGSLNGMACLSQPGCHVENRAATDGGTPSDAGSPRDCADAGVSAQFVIDDMEDQTQAILGSDAYGSWYVYHDDTVGGHMTPDSGAPFIMEPIPGGRCASEYAMRMSGTGFSQWGAGMGFDFGYGGKTDSGSVVKIPVDARAYAGVRLWARVGDATATNINFSILAGTCPPPDGGDDASAAGAPSDCALSYAKKLVLTNEWVRYDIAFDELLSNPDRLPIPRDQIYSFGFTVPAGTTFDLWIDDISWIPGT